MLSPLSLGYLITNSILSDLLLTILLFHLETITGRDTSERRAVLDGYGRHETGTC